MKWKLKSLSGGLLLIVSICCISCSSSDHSPVEEIQGPISDPTLVGIWTSTIDGGLGEATIVIDLKGDGAMSGEGADSPYCPMTATWEVLGSSFIAAGKDDCDGTSVSFTAPYSKTQLKGTWNASSGNDGTFSVRKQ